MKRVNILHIIFVLTALISLSCVKDLDVNPIDPDVNSANKIYTSEEGFKQGLAKCYASYALSGQQGGGGGNPDIQGIDEGFGNYLRQLWGLNELCTDEAIIAWDDATIKSFHWQTWAANDVFLSALYSRIFYTITICNEFIRNTDKAPKDIKAAVDVMKAEARFLRAFSYFHAIDMFGNVPFVTEADKPGAFLPKRIERADLFAYIESELKELSELLAAPKSNEYGRVDKAAAWMLLAKLYMNAKVYTGTEKNTEALTYINQVLNAGFALDDNYAEIFMADNHTSPEIIFPICFDGIHTQQYGGMTFILHASNGGGMPLNGIDGGWGGIRTIKDFVAKFDVTAEDFSSEDPEFKNIADKRGMFYFDPSSWEWDIKQVGTFTQGIGVTKFKNISSDGGPAPNAHPTFVSTDFPVFRLADAYLMYAEAVLRGGGGDKGTAVAYVNLLRERAYGDNSHNITATDLTLDFLLDERARELYWEGHRRSDLVRFEKLTGGEYLWEWKGNVQEGAPTEAFRNLYPIPANDLMANPNLQQNPGY